MGGIGSGRKPDPVKLINRQFNPIATQGNEGIFLPNHSGDHSKGIVLSTPTKDTDLANKKYVDDSVVTPAGNNTEIQFNDNGSFSGSSSLVWTGTRLNIGANAYIQAGGGVIATTNEIYAGAGSSAGDPAYTFGTDTDTGMYSPTTDTLGFTTSGAERVRIDNSGKVGIGITSPNEKLCVGGTFTCGDLYLQDVPATQTNSWHFTPVDGVGLNLTESGVADYRMFWKDGGNVGIGTNNPLATLHVSGSIYANGNVSGAYIYGDGSNLTGLSAGSPGGSDTQIQFNDSGSFSGASDMVYSSGKIKFFGSLNALDSFQVSGTMSIPRNTGIIYFDGDEDRDSLLYVNSSDNLVFRNANKDFLVNWAGAYTSTGIPFQVGTNTNTSQNYAMYINNYFAGTASRAYVENIQTLAQWYSTGTCTNLTGINIRENQKSGGAGAVINNHGISITAQNVVCTNNYGIKINDISNGSSSNYALYSASGAVSLGDTLILRNSPPVSSTANQGKIYVSGGALYFMGGSGTLTTLAAA